MEAGFWDLERQASVMGREMDQVLTVYGQMVSLSIYPLTLCWCRCILMMSTPLALDLPLEVQSPVGLSLTQ